MSPWRVAIVITAVVISVGGRSDDAAAVSDGACSNDTTGHAYYACLYPFALPRCDDVPVPTTDFTVVTALLDLKREEWPHFKRSFQYYLYYSVQVFKLNVPLVAYVDEQVKDYVAFQRRGKEHITRIIVVDLSDLEYFSYKDTITAIMQSVEFGSNNALLTHPEGFSAEYNILMNSKLSLLHSAAEENHFRSAYFFWVDAGYGHGKDVFPDSCTWAPRNLMRGNDDRVTYIQLVDLSLIESVYSIYKKPLPPFVNGGFFGGSRKALDEYYNLHKTVFDDLLRQNMVDDDQTVAVACYFAKPELFNMVPGSWYDAFNMFK